MSSSRRLICEKLFHLLIRRPPRSALLPCTTPFQFPLTDPLGIPASRAPLDSLVRFLDFCRRTGEIGGHNDPVARQFSMSRKLLCSLAGNFLVFMCPAPGFRITSLPNHHSLTVTNCYT